jgi:hypothetical protein
MIAGKKYVGIQRQYFDKIFFNFITHLLRGNLVVFIYLAN